MNNCTVFLLVKDPAQGNYLKYRFNSAGFRDVTLFHNQNECIYTIRRNMVPDYIIADTSMKGLKDIEFMRFIKTEEPQVKVLFFSDCDDNSNMSAILEEGATDYIHKNGNDQNWFHELISNLQYLIREEFLSR